MKIKFTLIMALAFFCHNASFAQAVLAVTISGQDTVCTGATLSLLAQSSDTNATFSWTGPNGFAANSASVSIANVNPNVAGTYYVTATDTSSASYPDSIVIVVIQTPDVYPVSSQSLCNGGSYAINFSGSNANAVLNWSNDNTSIGLSANDTGSISSFQAINSGSSPAIANITVTPTYFGCTGSSESFVIEVYPSITPSLNISSNTGNNICSGTQVMFTASGNNGGTAPVYQWVKNGVNVGTSSLTYTDNTLNNSDIVTCVLTSNANCVTTNTANSNADTFTVYNLPVVTSEPISNTTCAGGNATYTFAATGTNLIYQWQVDAGSGFNNINDIGPYSGTSTNTLSVAGASIAMNGYNYRCVVSGTCAPNAISSAVLLNVNSLPAVASQPVNSAICDGTNTNFAVSATGTNLSYQWQVNTGAGFTNIANNSLYSGATTNNLSLTGASASVMNNYTYQCIVSGACSPAVVTGMAVLSFNPSPVASIAATGPTTFCQGGNVVINANTNPNYSYQWLENGLSINLSTNSSIQVSDPGSYAIAITNNYGCTTVSSPISVSNYVTPAAPLNVLMGTLSLCQGNTVVLGTNVATGLSYQWQNNNVNIAGATNATYTTTNAGNYSVVVSNANCTSTSSSADVVVNPYPSNSITVNNPPVICSDGGGLLMSAIPASGQTYQWYENGLALNGANGYQLTATIGGVYDVTITSTAGCIAYSQSVTAIYSISPVPLITQQGAVLNADPYASYQWYFNGNAIAGAINSSYTMTQNGTYTVMATNSYGCSGMSAPFIIGNLSVGTIAANSAIIKIYPNPVSSILHIDAASQVKVSVINMQGQVVLTQNDVTSIDMSQIPNGIYMVQVLSENNELLTTERLVKSAF